MRVESSSRRGLDLKCVRQPLAKGVCKLRLAGHHAPKLLTRRAGEPREVLLREAATDTQHLDVLPEWRELGNAECLSLGTRHVGLTFVTRPL